MKGNIRNPKSCRYGDGPVERVEKEYQIPSKTTN